MMPFKLIAGSLAVAVMLCLVSAARAQNDIVSFDERAGFTAASTGLTKVDFEGLAPNSGVKNYTMPGGLAAGGHTGSVAGIDCKQLFSSGSSITLWESPS